MIKIVLFIIIMKVIFIGGLFISKNISKENKKKQLVNYDYKI